MTYYPGVTAWLNTYATSLKAFPSVAISNTPQESLSSASFPSEIIWLAGAPGAGKGTNSSFISNTCGFRAPSIVMSSLLENPECKRIKDAGGMVDDATVSKALLKELAKPEYRNGVVVDGFPRTEQQAAWLRNLHESMAEEGRSPKFSFMMLFISEESSIARQLARGKAVHELNEVRKLGGLAPMELRATDVCEAAARTRYEVFAQQYDAVSQLAARFPLSVVDASASIDVVRSRLSAALKVPSSPSFSPSVSKVAFM